MKHALGSLMVAALVIAAALSGCGAKEEVKRTVDCAQLCSKYSECIKDIDVTACTDQCEDQAQADPSYANRGNTCEECIENKACAQAEPCWTDCPVVPVPD